MLASASKTRIFSIIDLSDIDMKVTIYFGGGSGHGRMDEYDLEQIINERVIELQRVPNQGEHLSLWIDRYWIDCDVKYVFTNYVEPGNPYIKERAWGDRYAIMVNNVELMEEYK